MPNPSEMDRTHGRSLPQRISFSSLHILILLFTGWLLMFDGFSRLPGTLVFSDPDRALVLWSCALLYCLRHALTLFYLLQRRISWAEALGLIAFIGLFEVGFLLLGAGVLRQGPVPFDAIDVLAFFLLLFGSYLNSFSELQRKRWKADPANQGRCYTGGWFRHSMHINFFGDVVLFSGWALFTRYPWALALPLLMTLMFIFFHIPKLDAYLLGRYGAEFRAYASRTKKLIPFVY